MQETHKMLLEQGAQSARISNVESDIKEIKDELKKVVEFVNETRGGYRFFWGVIGAASALGAIVGYVLSYIKAH